MNIVKATKKYEAWRADTLGIVASDLQQKHKEMAKKPFPPARQRFMLGSGLAGILRGP